MDEKSKRAARTARLSAALAEWRRMGATGHLLGIGLIALVILVRWFPEITRWPEALSDELAYVRAIDRVIDGESPYRARGYFYPAAFAYIGAWIDELVGRRGTLALIRGANVLGLATAIWCAAAWLPWTRARRIFAGVAFLLLAPAVHYGVIYGNLSLAISGMIIVGLLIAHNRPWLSGLLLGFSTGIKPVAPLAIACVGVHRPVDKNRKYVLAAGLGLVIGAVLLLVFPHLDEMLKLTGANRAMRTVSPHRFLVLLGLDWNVLWVSSVIALIALVFLRSRELGPTHLLCFAITATLAATPVVWSHTLLLTLPIQVIAAWIAFDRRRLGETARFELLFVLLAIAGLQFSTGAAGIYDQSVVMQAAATAIPALSPALLTLYIFRQTESF